MNSSSINSLTNEETVALFRPECCAISAREMGAFVMIVLSTISLFFFFTICWFQVVMVKGSSVLSSLNINDIEKLYNKLCLLCRQTKFSVIRLNCKKIYIY